MTDDRLTGAWKLVDFRLTGADGGTSRPFGGDAAGLLIYTADGHMSAATSFPDGSESVFYCGPYEALEGENRHVIEFSSNPALVGTTQRRQVRFEGETMILTASPSISGGPGTSAEIAWRRA